MLQPMGSQRTGHDLATEQQNGKTMDLVDIKLENIDSGFVENMGEDVISISDFNQCLKMNIKAHTSSHLSAPVQVESSCPPGGRGEYVPLQHVAVHPGMAGQAQLHWIPTPFQGGRSGC